MAENQEPISYKDFSKRIKEKYPEYKDVDDLVLSQKMVEKYPDYKGTVIFDEVKKKEPTASSVTPSQLPKVLEQGANVVSGGILSDISKTVPKTEPKEKVRSKYDQPKQNANRFLDIGEPVVDPNFGKNKAGLMVGQVPDSKPAFAPELAIKKGQLQGQLANILSTGKRPTEDELGSIAMIQSELQSLPQSQADAAFQKDGWSIFKKDPLLGAEFLGETVLSSLTSLFEAGKRTVPAAIGIGAAAGAPIAGIGAIGGAISGLTAGVTTGGFNLSTSGKIIQVLSDEGVDVTDRDALVAAFSDEEKMSKIRNRALKYAIPIAAFDAISGSVAGKLVTGAAGKSLAKRTLAGFGEMGIQSAAGMAGEAGGQYLADGKLNRDEILLEGIAGFVTDVPEIVSGVAMEKLKNPSSNKKTLSKQVALLGNEIGADDAKYNLNRDLANKVITPEEHEQGIAFVEKAVEANNKIPENVVGEGRAESIELLAEKDEIKYQNEFFENQKQLVDEAYHKDIDEEIAKGNKRVEEINEKLFKISKQKPPKEEVIQQPIELSPDLPEGYELPNQVVEEIPDENIQQPIEQPELVEAIRVEQEPIVGLNKDNKQPFTTKSKKQVVSFENGDLIVRDAKTNEEVSPKTKKKALREYAESFDFTVGEKAATPTEYMQFRDENELNQYIVDNSQNPSELVEVYVNQEPTTAPLSSIERMVADYGIGKVTNKSFERFGDRNLKGLSMAKAYFNNQTGQSIDQVAKEMSDHYDVEITPQDIADFMVRFPNGESSALKLVESEVAVNAAAKFKELTGLNLNQEIAQKVIEQQFNKLSKAEQLIAQQDYESATQLEEAYWREYEQTNGFTKENVSPKVEPKEPRNAEAEIGKQPIGEAKPKQEDVEYLLDDDGKKMVVYHGAKGGKVIENFDLDEAAKNRKQDRFELGIHFGTEENEMALANTGGVKPQPYHLKFTRELDLGDEADSFFPITRFNVMGLLDVLPKEVTDLLPQGKDAIREMLRGDYMTPIREALINSGYDLIAYNNYAEDNGQRNYIALDPSQIEFAGKKEQKVEAKPKEDVKKEEPKKEAKEEKQKFFKNKPNARDVIIVDIEKVKSEKPKAFDFLRKYKGHENFGVKEIRNALAIAYSQLMKYKAGAETLIEQISELEDILAGESQIRKTSKEEFKKQAKESGDFTSEQLKIFNALVDSLDTEFMPEYDSFEGSLSFVGIDSKKTPNFYSLPDNILAAKNPDSFIHEIGHFAFFNILSKEDRIKYLKYMVASTYGAEGKPLRDRIAMTSEQVEVNIGGETFTFDTNVANNFSEYFAEQFRQWYLKEKTTPKEFDTIFEKVEKYLNKLIDKLKSGDYIDKNLIEFFDKIIKDSKKEEPKSPLEEKYEQINKLRGEKVQKLAKEKLISDNFDGIVAQLMTKNKIKRKC